MRTRDEGRTDEFLRARAQHVTDLVRNHAGWEHLRSEIEEQVADLDKQILGGELDSVRYAAYCGRRKGLMYVLALPDALIRNAPKEGPDA